MIQVRDLAHLVELVDSGRMDYFILLGGVFRSSKAISWYSAPNTRYKTGRFFVVNEIDDTEQVLWPKQLWTKSNIGAALDAGALYSWGL